MYEKLPFGLYLIRMIKVKQRKKNLLLFTILLLISIIWGFVYWFVIVM